jgi:hypothetical protein
VILYFKERFTGPLEILIEVMNPLTQKDTHRIYKKHFLMKFNGFMDLQKSIYGTPYSRFYKRGLVIINP